MYGERWGVKKMKCPVCKSVVKPVLGTADIHRKQKEWYCVNCKEIIKSQFIIDGEVQRTLIKGRDFW